MGRRRDVALCLLASVVSAAPSQPAVRVNFVKLYGTPAGDAYCSVHASTGPGARSVTLKNARANWEYSPPPEPEALGAALRFSTPAAQLRNGDEILISVDGVERGKAVFSDDGGPAIDVAELLPDGEVRFYAEGESMANVASWFATCRGPTGGATKILFVGNETRGMSCNATAVYAVPGQDVLSWPVSLLGSEARRNIDSVTCVWWVVAAAALAFTTLVT